MFDNYYIDPSRIRTHITMYLKHINNTYIQFIDIICTNLGYILRIICNTIHVTRKFFIAGMYNVTITVTSFASYKLVAVATTYNTIHIYYWFIVSLYHNLLAIQNIRSYVHAFLFFPLFFSLILQKNACNCFYIVEKYFFFSIIKLICIRNHCITVFTIYSNKNHNQDNHAAIGMRNARNNLCPHICMKNVKYKSINSTKLRLILLLWQSM